MLDSRRCTPEQLQERPISFKERELFDEGPLRTDLRRHLGLLTRLSQLRADHWRPCQAHQLMQQQAMEHSNPWEKHTQVSHLLQAPDGAQDGLDQQRYCCRCLSQFLLFVLMRSQDIADEVLDSPAPRRILWASVMLHLQRNTRETLELGQRTLTCGSHLCTGRRQGAAPRPHP